jgi:cold shock protein
MKIGTVKWFNLQKGYGFFHPDDGSPNVFVHTSTLEKAGMSDLKAGQRVISRLSETSAPATRPPCRWNRFCLQRHRISTAVSSPRIRSISFLPSFHRQCRSLKRRRID